MAKTKTISRVTAWLLALLLVVGTCFVAPSTSVSAANEGTLNIHKLSSSGSTTPTSGVVQYQHPVTNEYHDYIAGARYDAYKIGELTQTTSAGGVVSANYEPVSTLVDTSGTPIATLSNSTNPTTIDVGASSLTSVANVLTTNTGAAPMTLDKDNVYLIKETGLPAGVTKGTDFIVTIPMYNAVSNAWDYVIDAYPKNTAGGSITKSISTIAGSAVTASSTNAYYGNIGDTIAYSVAVDVPTDYTIADYATFDIVDTPSAYLDIQTSTIAVSGSVSGSHVATTDYAVTYTANKLTIAFTTAGLAKLQAGEALTITYDATILTGADTASGGLANSAQIDFAKTPAGGGGTGTIPPTNPTNPTNPTPTVKIYSYGIQKVDDAATPAALAGATFVLATKDALGAYEYLTYNTLTDAWDVTTLALADPFTTTINSPVTGLADEAILHFTNLDPSTQYYLVETVAPSGFVLSTIDFPIQATTASTDDVYNAFTYNTATSTYDYVADTAYTIQIQNVATGNSGGLIPGGGLPSTGGAGIYIFTIGGLLLIGGAVVLYLHSRKKA